MLLANPNRAKGGLREGPFLRQNKTERVGGNGRGRAWWDSAMLSLRSEREALCPVDIPHAACRRDCPVTHTAEPAQAGAQSVTQRWTLIDFDWPTRL